MLFKDALKLINDHRAQWDLPALDDHPDPLGELARIEEHAQYGNNPFDNVPDVTEDRFFVKFTTSSSSKVQYKPIYATSKEAARSVAEKLLGTTGTVIDVC